MIDARTTDLMSELHSSPLLSHLAAELTGITDVDPAAAQWIVRIVMSLAFRPAPADYSGRVSSWTASWPPCSRSPEYHRTVFCSR